MPRIVILVVVVVIALGLACSPRRRHAGERPIATPAIAPDPATRSTRGDAGPPAGVEELAVLRSLRQREPDRDVDAVFRSLHDQLLGCYARRLATHPTAHAHLTLEVLVGEDGRPLRVVTSGGALLGGETLGCIERHVRTLAFEPPRGGGTTRVRVPISFHPGEPCEEG